MAAAGWPVADWAGLVLAGHTHGGQVYIPGIGRPVVPSQYGERFAIGHIVEDGRHLFVSSGTGTGSPDNLDCRCRSLI